MNFTKITVDEITLQCAVRYALGRRSYIVSTICNEVKNNIKELSSGALGIILKDIEEQEACTYLNKPLGDRCDTIEWLSLKEIISKELENRVTK